MTLFGKLGFETSYRYQVGHFPAGRTRIQNSVIGLLLTADTWIPLLPPVLA